MKTSLSASVMIAACWNGTVLGLLAQSPPVVWTGWTGGNGSFYD